MKDFSYITHSHPSYIEGLYKDYVENPDSVDPEFRKFFEGFDFAIGNGNGKAATAVPPTTTVSVGNLQKEFQVYHLIQAYRRKGHLVAHTNPIRPRKDRGANLDLKYFGLTEADMNTGFAADSFIGLENASLKDILARLQQIYTGSIGVEYDYIIRQDRHEWLQKEIETKLSAPLPRE